MRVLFLRLSAHNLRPPMTDDDFDHWKIIDVQQQQRMVDEEGRREGSPRPRLRVATSPHIFRGPVQSIPARQMELDTISQSTLHSLLLPDEEFLQIYI